MHVYGDAGEVVFDFGDGLAVKAAISDAEKAHSQLGPAIREALHQEMGQARLFVPPVPAESSARV